MKLHKIIFISFLAIAINSSAQLRPTDLDKSPMDMSYSPQNYPILKMNGNAVSEPSARVIYSRPQKSGRQIFGNIVAYDQVWRLGANEATEIEFFRNVSINDKKVAKGRYTMYAICSEIKWTVIFNNEKDVWGLAYNSKKDVLRVDLPVQHSDDIVEAYTMYFEDTKSGTTLNILWDDVKVSMPITF